MQNADSNTHENTGELIKIIDVLLDRAQKDTPEVRESLSSLFDLLLWAEKRNEGTLQIVIDSKLMLILLEKYKDLINLLVSGYILLLGNAKDEGILVTHLLENQLPEQVLAFYLNYLANQEEGEEEEHLQLLGSYLKAYHRHLTAKTIAYFVSNERSMLITICCQFFNCPEEITRTSIMNILMNILKQPCSAVLLSYPKIRAEIDHWCTSMCRLLRNELKDFDQNLLTTEQSESEYIIHLINDKIFLWEDLSGLSEQLFSEAFYNEIIIPLVVGSLNTNGIPLFTLKFALFILNKLGKTIANLDLINELGSILFASQEITYKDNQLGTASLKPFSLKSIASNPSFELAEEEGEEYELNEFKQVNQLFFNILRSKDSRFLECICILIVNILTEMKKSPKYISFYIKQLGFGVNGVNTITISEILINQFNAIHSLEINRMVCCLLVFIQPTKYFTDELKNRFIHVYKGHLDESLRNMEKFKDKYDYITEIFEYDARTISGHSFQMELKTDAALIFNNQIIENEIQPFFRQIPETDQNLLRYSLAKALLLRKLSMQLIEECAHDRTLEKYVERSRAIDAKYIKPGEYLKLPLNCQSYRCKLVDEKIEIPNCLLLEDDNNLILGYLQNMSIKIIINIKMKHITPSFKAKKDKLYIEIDIRKYDQQKMHDLIEMKGVTLKHVDMSIEYFRIKKNRLKEREMMGIADVLRNAKGTIPEISLI